VLELLSLEGCIVTTDALHCHRVMARTILERGGDYVLASLESRGRAGESCVKIERSGIGAARRKSPPGGGAQRGQLVDRPLWGWG
jgi:hypothetical protein